MHDIADRKSRTFWSYAILRKSKVTYSRKSPGEKFSRSFLTITFFEPFDRCISPKTESQKLVSFSSDHLSYETFEKPASITYSQLLVFDSFNARFCKESVP